MTDLKYPVCPICGERLFFTPEYHKGLSEEVKQKLWMNLANNVLSYHLEIHKKKKK